jgi:hypothetical protein
MNKLDKSKVQPGEGQTNSETDLPVKLSQPARRALLGKGYSRLEQLAGVREADILQLHGMGPKAMDQLRHAMADRGLSFAEGS